MQQFKSRLIERKKTIKKQKFQKVEINVENHGTFSDSVKGKAVVYIPFFPRRLI